MKPGTHTPVVKELLEEGRRLYARNGAITKAGGFFTPEQVENERRINRIRQELRFGHGIAAANGIRFFC